MATIRDVAREAGVSIATVSRVFNDSSLVSEPTVRNVREVASRLNYWPNGVARSLITSRTHALGVLLPDMYGEFFSDVIRGLDTAARQHGFHLLVSSSHADSEALSDALRSMSGRVDGMVVMAPDVDAPGAIKGFSVHCPVVLLNPGQEVDECDTISVANSEGASDMVRHLLGLGHRRIAIVRGPSRNLDAEQRLHGYRAALREAGIPHEPGLELQGDFTEPSGYEAAAELARMPGRPTAVFVANDHMAIGVLSGLLDSGVSVPNDVAVVGFDDIAMSRYTSPPLTTVRVNTTLLGERAVELLMRSRRSANPDVKQHEVLPTSLAVRSSCGSRPRRGGEPLRWRREKTLPASIE
ncbi:MAG: LacI family DNA-binding transcriptional regulator [Candidatus Eisenbacteria bacterium]|nr:LacI family DNA-binding transcriptional regulator [Candidatus Eisenbacteria bacterium]